MRIPCQFIGIRRWGVTLRAGFGEPTLRSARVRCRLFVIIDFVM